MRTVDAVRGNWAVVFEHLGLPPVTGKRHFSGECPICGSKKDFRIDDKDGSGSFICKCSSGDGWKLLEMARGLKFREASNLIDRLIGNKPDSTRTEKKPDEFQARRNRVIAAWKKLPAISPDNEAGAYLHSREICQMPSHGSRYAEKTALGYSAILSLVTDENCDVLYTHTTYLQNEAKAKINCAKKLESMQSENALEYAKSPAIRLMPHRDTLGISEGIETALSASQIYDLPCWSVVNTAFMKRFRAPDKVKHLIIFADADVAGFAAAYQCAERNIHTVKTLETVTVRWRESGDFNDQLKEQLPIQEMVFRKKGRKNESASQAD